MRRDVFTPTQEQSRAIRSTGRSVIVSAAAGSGKTAVLAERCAYLVCDAPDAERCDIGALLVLTFTDAAAAEMRSRIVDSIRRRLADRPRDRRLLEQATLADAAQISTIHSFCLWLVRRWFNRAGLEPTATVLDADEASVVKREVLDTLFAELHASVATPDDPLGRAELEPAEPVNRVDTGSRDNGDAAAPEDWMPERRTGAVLGAAFVQLVDDYGLGDERDVSAMVLRLYEFLGSLPAPRAWLGEAVDRLARNPESVVRTLAEELLTELKRQARHCGQLAETLEAANSAGHFHASQIRMYGERLSEWATALAVPDEGAAPYDQISLSRFEFVRKGIVEFEFDKVRAPKLPKDADEEARKARSEAGRLVSEHIKKELLKKRLKTRFSLFTVEDSIAGLRATAPYVATLADLVLAFQGAYARKKRQLNVLDFTDLERLAFDLLRDGSASSRSDGMYEPSDVARALHHRFSYVLVDEFQDINPIQLGILQLVSRESDPMRCDNLFAVGDVKQSIYRFRLAEPALFSARLQGFRAGHAGARGDQDGAGEAIFLQSNFRSRTEILEAVNVVFRQLLAPGAGGIEYDDQAELRAGRPVDFATAPEPVELHLLERSLEPRDYADTEYDNSAGQGDEDGDSNRSSADSSDPARWTPIEREAFLIGSRIRDWMSCSDGSPHAAPRRYGDIAVLLRAAKVNAERIAAVLASMGIPAYAEVGGSLFGALEVRDVLAALQMLDNFQQDIPLAAILRSGVFGERLTEDDLIKIRRLDLNAAFHAVARRYLEEGGDADLRDRLRSLWDRINRYRNEATRRPLAETLWRLYEDEAYLAYASGLTNGMQRRANLLKLHDLARRFGTFRRQGLHRFLMFVRSLEAGEQEIDLPPVVGESQDVVRIMSIHRAKGLEFPLVFVAGLGTRFNLGDRSGRMIFERTARIGLRVVDTRRMIEYPSVAHTLVVQEIERSTRDEEIRILYVAMTRAREKLVLVGSRHGVGHYGGPGWRAASGRPPTRLAVATAATPLDWLLPALASAPAGSFEDANDRASGFPSLGIPDRRDVPLFKVRTYGVEEMAGWSLAAPADDTQRRLRAAVARCESLPPKEPVDGDEAQVEKVLRRVDFVYPHLASSSVRATMAASEFKGAYDFTRNGGERQEQTAPTYPAGPFELPSSKYTAKPSDRSAHRGIITHRVLEHLDFAVAVDAGGVASELQRMVECGLLSEDDRPAVLEEAITWFVSTPLAEAIRGAGTGYRREFRYVTTEPVTFFDSSVDGAPDDRVLVRGIVDGILSDGRVLEIVDFKTDAVDSDEVPDRCERYRPQISLYSRAVSRIFNKPVGTSWLAFLTPRVVVPIRYPGMDDLSL